MKSLKRKSLAVFALLVTAAVIAGRGTVTEASFTNINLTVPEFYEIFIELQGAGRAVAETGAGSQEIYESGIVSVEKGGKLTLFLYPEEGNKVKSVLYQGEEQTDAVGEQKLSLTGIQEKGKITVIFEKEQGPVNTGDKTWEKACILIIIGAAGTAGMLLLLAGRKKPLN